MATSHGAGVVFTTPRTDVAMAEGLTYTSVDARYSFICMFTRTLERELAAASISISDSTTRIAALEDDLSAARQSLYEVAAQRNELHAILEKHSINAEPQ